jgi:hypothetical protein
MPGTAHIGFDFGSSLIKVAVRLQDVGEQGAGASFGVVLDGTEPSKRYRMFRKTSISVIGNGPQRQLCLRGSPPKSRRFDGLKEVLLPGFESDNTTVLNQEFGETGLSRIQAAALLTVSVFDDVRKAMILYCRESKLVVPDTILINCAVPSSETMMIDTSDALAETHCPFRNGFAALVERCRRFVFIDAQRIKSDPISLKEAIKTAQMVLDTPLPEQAGSSGTTCIPEALAAVVAAIRHRGFRDGLFFVFDVGAFTTDASLFFFHPHAPYKVMCYYGIGTCLAGVGRDTDSRRALAPAIAMLMQTKVGLLYQEMIDAMIAQHDSSFRVLFKHSPMTNTPCWQPILLGGGAEVKQVNQVIAGLCVRSSTGDAYRIAPHAYPPKTFPLDNFASVVFVNSTNNKQQVFSRRELRTPDRYNEYCEALIHPSHILQLAIGLSSPVFGYPMWSAAELPPDQRWRYFDDGDTADQ